MPRIHHGTEHGDQLKVEVMALDQVRQFHLYVVEGHFALFQEHQVAGRQLDDLTAEFGTDGAPRSGDHHTLAGNAATQQIPPRRNGIAAQQILNHHVLDLGETGATAGDIAESGHRLHPNIKLFKPVDQRNTPMPGHGGHCQQDGVQAAAADRLAQALPADHRHTAQQSALLTQVVVHHQHRTQFAARLQRGDELSTGTAAAEHRHGAPLQSTGGQAPQPATRQITAHTQITATQQPENNEDRARHHDRYHVGESRQSHDGGGHTRENGLGGLSPQIAHHRPVEAEGV